eukprot:TRINITY_DN14413_c0_g1_i1.p1 TRINITY_DN14413_c0_g1~~TRINITY_DN14413_c0_g1_i1.p1  ORF type:complete len:124 (+),score=26.00 TRINITY_DN14413_c0_g1_i1:27-374(+)
MGLGDWLFPPDDPDSLRAQQKFERAIASGVHITGLKGQHPYHPYDPAIDRTHPCHQPNQALFKCFDDDVRRNPDAPLQAHHVQCFLVKTDLMVCLTKYRQAARSADQAASATDSG